MLADGSPALGLSTSQIRGLQRGHLVCCTFLKGFVIPTRPLTVIRPPYDSSGITSLLAANLLYEFICVPPPKRGGL